MLVNKLMAETQAGWNTSAMRLQVSGIGRWVVAVRLLLFGNHPPTYAAHL